ncbi:MAG: NAD(P)-dependent oxidoreductase [Vampirovibrionales bacterium]|nr:NAD(P)-dependent oxidoreductase [Vampirovibrionales bacterium]
MSKATIGFVGLGRMGANMARRLKDCGYAITALYDAAQNVAQSLADELGSPEAAVFSLAQVTKNADVIITVVSDDQGMRDIYENADDNLFMGASGKHFLNCATVSPATHIHLMEKAAFEKAAMLELPMASSIPQAREGKLFLMCAGDKSVFEETKSLLADMAASTVYTGGPGTAASMKALVNMVMNINTAGLAEGLGLAEALGLDLTLVRQVFAQTGANSRVLETDGEDMQNRAHDVYFSAAHAAKDSGIALSLAEDLGLSLPLALAAKAQYERMIAEGLGELDKSGISELTFKGRQAKSLILE